MTSVALIKTCLNIAYYSGATHLLSKPLRGLGSILCLHHVVPFHNNHGEFAPNAKLEISPEFLEQIINAVRRLGYETVSLSEATARIKNPQLGRKPFIAFTLDDGYRDNLIHAQPVFTKLNCPYTIFVAPGIVEGTVELWWRALEKIIADNISIFVEIEGKVYSYKTQTVAEKYQAWNTISETLQNAPEFEQRKITQHLAMRYGLDLKALCLQSAMNWDEIRQIAKDPLCSIGAHTINHFAVSKLESETAHAEIKDSKLIISSKLSTEITHFAYPYGTLIAAGIRDFEIAAQAGFSSSVTTRKGPIHQQHKDHMQALPRVMVSGRYAKLRYITAIMSGLPSFVMNGFRHIDVR